MFRHPYCVGRPLLIYESWERNRYILITLIHTCLPIPALPHPASHLAFKQTRNRWGTSCSHSHFPSLHPLFHPQVQIHWHPSFLTQMVWPRYRLPHHVVRLLPLHWHDEIQACIVQEMMHSLFHAFLLSSNAWYNRRINELLVQSTPSFICIDETIYYSVL